MKPTPTAAALAILWLTDLVSADECNPCKGNECCANQVTGTKCNNVALTQKQSDCMSFMTTTVYASPTYTAAKDTVYLNNAPNNNGLGKRDPVTSTGSIPAYASSCTLSSEYSSVCSCWGYGPTATTVSTPITTVVPQPATCYEGMQYAYYSFTKVSAAIYTPSATATPGFLPQNDAPPASNEYLSQYKADVFQGQTPVFSGQTPELGFWSGGCGPAGPSYNVYGGGVITDSTYTGLQQRGYFLPQADSVYTVTVSPAVDDVVCFWYGASAVTSPSVGNALFCLPYGNGPATGIFAVQKGVPVPFRIQWANAQNCAEFDMTIVDNIGNPILTPATGYSTSVLQYCVNNNGALPPFPDWPLETFGGVVARHRLWRPDCQAVRVDGARVSGDRVGLGWKLQIDY